MKFNSKLFLALIITLATQVTFSEVLKKSDRCPSVEAIRQVGVNCIVFSSDGDWAASNVRNGYDTNVEWTLSVGNNGEKAKDENEARQKVMNELQSLTLTKGPIYDEIGDTVCWYKTNKIDGIMAITPRLRGVPSHCS